MWLTNKKTGKPFNTDWIDGDANAKERQINTNSKEADKLNGKESLRDKINNIKTSDFDNTDKIDFGDGNYIKKREDGRYAVHFKTETRSGTSNFDTPDECIKKLKQVHKLKSGKSSQSSSTVKSTVNTVENKIVEGKVTKEDFYSSAGVDKEDLANEFKNTGIKEDPYSASHKTNPNYRKKSEPYYKYHQNCQRCVVAYEMRRRGYDVEAKPKENEFDSFGNGNATSNYTKCLVSKDGTALNKGWVNVGAKDLKTLKDNIRMTANYYGDGSRFFLKFKWGSGTGHVIVVENEGGVLRFVDPQRGSSNCWDSIKYGSVDTNKFQIVRVDDKKLTYMIRQAVKKKGGN